MAVLKERILKKLDVGKKDILFLYMLFLVLNTILALFARSPTIMPDEGGPTAIAAHLAGYDWSVISRYRNYYGYGLAFFYIPAFVLLNDGVLLYKALIVINGILISFIPTISYCISIKFLQLDRKNSFMYSIVIGLLPCYMAVSKKAWNETMVSLVLWIVLYLLLDNVIDCLNKTKIHNNSILLGIALVYGYITHGRFIAILGTIITIFLIYSIFYKKHIVHYVPFSISVILGLIADKFLKSYFLKHVWLVENESMMRNTLDETLLRVLNNLSLEIIFIYLRAFSGYIFNLLAVSCGLIALGIVILIHHNKAVKSIQMSVSVLALFGILSIVYMIVVSSVFFTTDLLEGHYVYIYGRYTEFLLGPMLLLTFYLINKFGIAKKHLYIFLSVTVSSFLITYCLEKNDVKIFPLNAMSLVALSPSNTINNLNEFIIVLVIAALLVCLLAFCLSRKNEFLSLVLLSVVFLFMTYKINSRLISNSTNTFNNVVSTYRFIDTLDNSYYDLYTYKVKENILSYQFLIKSKRVYVLSDDRLSNLNENSIIISCVPVAEMIDMAPQLKDRLYQICLNEMNGGSSEVLLVYGSQLADELSVRGYTLEFCDSD